MTSQTPPFPPKLNIDKLRDITVKEASRAFDGLSLSKVTFSKYEQQIVGRGETHEKYPALIFELDKNQCDLTAEEQERINELEGAEGFMIGAGNDSHSMNLWHLSNSDFSEAYGESPPEDFMKNWRLFIRLRDKPIPEGIRLDLLNEVLFPVDSAQHHTGFAPEPTVADCENFVRALRFYFENENEIKIQQQPGKRLKTYNHESLGFDRTTTAEWIRFIGVIKGPDHYYRYGPSKRGRQKIREYDINRGRLAEINKKLVSFFNREYGLAVPDGFKTHEKAPEEGQGVRKFKFGIGTKVEKSEYDGYTKEDLLEKILKLTEQVNMVSNDPTKEAKLSKYTEALIVAATLANKKGWITEREMAKYLGQKWTPREQNYATPKRFPNYDNIAYNKSVPHD